MKSIVVPTGYMGSGSSAVTGLMEEIEGFNVPNSSYEYIFLHCPDGVFDLEDKLLIGNNAIRSDEAIHRFEIRMKALYNKKNFWAGSYNHFVSNKFMDFVDEFIEGLITDTFNDTYWYYQQEPNSVDMQMKLYFRRLMLKLTKRKIDLNIPLQYKEIKESYPTSDEFYTLAKIFINKIINELDNGENRIVLDQLLLPHNLFRMDYYFDEKIKVVVVERDPRDVFLLNKYVWKKKHELVPYPLEVEKFCKVYKKMRESERIIENNKIYRIHFEDLIYNYNDSIDNIFAFLEVDSQKHIRKKEIFNPERSIKNTQIFRLSDIGEEAIEEAKIITEYLGDYLYEFPLLEIKRNGIQELF